MLIGAGSDVNVRTLVLDETPLFVAIRHNHSKVLWALLRAPGIDKHATDQFGKTAIFKAVDNDSHQALKVLIEDGFDVECKYKGQTPLLLAASKLSVSTAIMLVEAGANITTKTSYGRTPLEEAAYQRENLADYAFMRSIEEDMYYDYWQIMTYLRDRMQPKTKDGRAK